MHLDIAPLPGKHWQEVNDVRVHKAIDIHGRPVFLSHRVESFNNPLGAETDANVIFFPNILIAQSNGLLFQGPQGAIRELPNPRIIPLVLRMESASGSLLREFEG